jgi:hypothetical protein
MVHVYKIKLLFKPGVYLELVALLEHISYLSDHLHSSPNFQSCNDKIIILYDEPV